MHRAAVSSCHPLWTWTHTLVRTRPCPPRPRQRRATAGMARSPQQRRLSLSTGSAPSAGRLRVGHEYWPRTRHFLEASARVTGLPVLGELACPAGSVEGGCDTAQPERSAHGDILLLTQPIALSRAAPKRDSGQAGVRAQPPQNPSAAGHRAVCK